MGSVGLTRSRREWVRAKGEASYLDDAGQLNCNNDVELAEPQDIGKALGKEPVSQIDAAAHISFNQTER